MGTQDPMKWTFPAAMTTLRAQLGLPPPHPAPGGDLPPRPLPEEARGGYCSQVKHNEEQIHPTETIQAFYQLICL